MNTEPNEAPASRDTDAAVGRLIGAIPETSWECLTLDGKATCFSASGEIEMAQFYGEKCTMFPGWEKQYKIGQWELWPTYSADTDGGYAAMREVLAWIESRGLWVRTYTPFSVGEPYFAGATPHGASGWNGRMDVECSAPSLPLAVCRLALAVANAEREAKS